MKRKLAQDRAWRRELTSMSENLVNCLLNGSVQDKPYSLNPESNFVQASIHLVEAIATDTTPALTALMEQMQSSAEIYANRKTEAEELENVNAQSQVS